MLCISHLDNGNCLLYGLSEKKIGRYQPIQKICAKLILQEWKYASWADALYWLHWLPIQQCIEFKILVLSYSCIHSDAPKYLQDCITLGKPKRHNLHSNINRTSLERPQVKYETFAAKSSSYSTPVLWNSLPQHIRETTTIDNIKMSF